MINYPFIICFFIGFLFGSMGLLVLSLIITAKSSNNIKFDEYDDALQQKAWEDSELSDSGVSLVSEQPNTDNNNNI